MYESNRELLTLCYDSVEEIRDGYYKVGLNGNYGVVDAGNEVVIPVVNHCIEKIDTLLFIEKVKGSGGYAHNIFNFERANNEEFRSISKFSDKAWLISQHSASYGLINSKGQQMLPSVFSNIWKCGSTSQYQFLKLKLNWINQSVCCGSNTENNKLSYIRANKDYTKFDGYFAFETEDDRVQIVATNLKVDKNGVITKYKYKIRVDGKLVGNEYTSILALSNLKPLKMVQTYNGTKSGTTYVGLMSYDGNEVVPCDRYNDVQYIGNGVTIVSKKGKYGTYVNKKEVVAAGTIDNINLIREIPISVAYINEDMYYIGNDGNIYKKLEEAFPIYKSKINRDINLMCMYGKWIYVENNLKLIKGVSEEVKDINQWDKL